MRKLIPLLAALLALVVAPAPAFADLRSDDYAFNFLNDSSVSVVSLKMISLNGQWSNNWLKTPVAPGTGLTLYFYNKGDTRCEVRTHILFADQSFYDEVVDYCGTAVLNARDDALYWE